MNLLITGGAGFIGSHFVDLALINLSNSSRITILDNLTYAGNLENLTEALKNKRVSFVKGSICDSNLVDQLTQGTSHIINFAAESHVDRSIEDSSEFVKTNVLGTQVLLEASVRNKVEKFVQISTDEVYGSIAVGSWDENSPLEPNSPYSASKASADLLVRSFSKTHNLNTNITRCSNNYGSRQYPEKLIPLFVQLLSEGRQVPVYGDGSNSRDWIHVSDHCRAIWLVLTEGKSGEIYNIGGGTELSNLNLTHRLINSVPGASLDQINFVTDRKGHDKRYSVDWQKARHELGYVPSADFDFYFKETVKYFLNLIGN